MATGPFRFVGRIVALVVVAAAALYIYHRAQPTAPPDMPGKVVVPGTEPSKPVGSPEPDFVMRHAHDLGLSPEQVEKLRTQAHDFAQSAAPLRKQLDAAGKEVAGELNRLSNRKVSLPDLQERTRVYRELSTKLAQLREAAWQEEQKILSPEQRKKALDAWARVHRLLPGAAPEGPGKSGEKSQGGGG